MADLCDRPDRSWSFVVARFSLGFSANERGVYLVSGELVIWIVKMDRIVVLNVCTLCCYGQ